MRNIKLTGREISIMRTMGFTEAMSGVDLLEQTRMDPEDVAFALNGLLSAGFVESLPYHEEISTADLETVSFEVNPAYVSDLRTAMLRR